MKPSITGNALTALKPSPGGPNIAEIAEANIRTMAARGYSDYAVVEGGNQGSNEFPYQPFLTDAYDYIAGLKRSRLENDLSNLEVEADKDDVEYLLRQRAQVENADFDRWVLQKYDLSNPGDRMVAQRVIPELFDRQKETLAYQTELQNRYAKLRIDGPKSNEDLKFEWLIESGRIQLPEGPLWDPKRWMENQMKKYNRSNVDYAADPDVKKTQLSIANRKRFKMGLFNPLKGISELQTGWQPNLNNPSDIRGIDDTVNNPFMFGQLFEPSDPLHPSYYYYGNPPITGDDLAYQHRHQIDGYHFGRGMDSVLNVGNVPPPVQYGLAQTVIGQGKVTDAHKAYGRTRELI